MKDSHLRKVGEVFSTGNLEIAQVKEKEFDLQQALCNRSPAGRSLLAGE